MKVNGHLIVNDGDVKNAVDAIFNVAGNVTVATGSNLTVNAMNNATAATGNTTKSWTIGGNLSLNGTATVSIEQMAAASVGGNLTIDKTATATFKYSSYTDVAKNIAINGTFTRVLSSGVATANPAKVWCESYTKGADCNITNGLPEKR